MSITPEQVAAGERRMQKLRSEYGAEEAHYDKATGRIVVSFPTGVQVSFDPQRTQGLDAATPQQLANIELSPAGLSLHFPLVDADVSVPALMHNVLGSERWMAQIGRVGGAVRSERKAASSRENGRQGGRPPKLV